MSKPYAKLLSLVLVLTLLVSVVTPALAATYRPGAQSGPSSSYASGVYYENYKRVPITGDNRTDLIAIALSQLGYQEGAANGNFSGEVSGRANYVEFSYNLGDLGLGYGGSDYPWCASFVTWCLYQSHCTDQATYKDLGRFHNGDYKIACHDWETGISESNDPVEYSGTNYRILSNLSVGDGIRLSGVTALNAGTDVDPGAFMKFIPKDAVRLSGENKFVDSGEGVMFPPDFNGGQLYGYQARQYFG